MGFLLAVLGFVVAEEVVELEPVKESSKNEYKCNSLTASGETACNADPYCYYLAAHGAHAAKCIDDPCLRYVHADESCVVSVIIDDATVVCLKQSVGSAAGHDCSGNAGSGFLCTQTDKSTSIYTYCEYTQLKDGKCADSICMASNNADKHCVKNSNWGSDAHPCKGLTKADCSLIPKCYWTSGACEKDICFQKKPSITECKYVNNNPLWTGSSFEVGTCTDWHPLSRADGSPLDYCIHKDNAKANICYFGNKNVTSSDTPPNDYPYDWSPKWNSGTNTHGTYPTYNYETGSDLADPDCATNGLPNCEGHGSCKTIVNQKGAFAGKYCTDGEHAAANILHVPSLLVFLVVVLGAMFSL